jgi:hypothetical protein
VYSETVTASFGEITSSSFNSGYKYDFPISVDGGTAAKYYYWFQNYALAEDSQKYLPLGSEAPVGRDKYQFKDMAAEGILVGQYVGAGATMYLTVVVECEDGTLTKPISMTVTAPSAE